MIATEMTSDAEDTQELDEITSKPGMSKMRSSSIDNAKTDSEVTSHQNVRFAPSPVQKPLEFMEPDEGTPAAQALAGSLCFH